MLKQIYKDELPSININIHDDERVNDLFQQMINYFTDKPYNLDIGRYGDSQVKWDMYVSGGEKITAHMLTGKFPNQQRVLTLIIRKLDHPSDEFIVGYVDHTKSRE